MMRDFVQVRWLLLVVAAVVFGGRQTDAVSASRPADLDRIGALDSFNFVSDIPAPTAPELHMPEDVPPREALGSKKCGSLIDDRTICLFPQNDSVPDPCRVVRAEVNSQISLQTSNVRLQV